MKKGTTCCLEKLHNMDLGTLFVRIALGVVFLHAGWLKVTNMEMTLSAFAGMGIAAWLTYIVVYAELLCGAAFILGLFVRYAGVVAAVIMLVATFKVHFANGFGMQNGGYEYTFVLFFLSLAAITLGAGKYSLCKMMMKK